MPRMRTVEVSRINIKVHTRHHPDEYKALWKALFSLRRPVMDRTGIALLLGQARHFKIGEREGIAGEIYRFVRINPEDPWYNSETGLPADQEEVAESVLIPDHLLPNLQRCAYFFDLKSHRLYFESKHLGISFGPQTIERFLNRLVSNPRIKSRFGDVVIQYATESEQIEWMLSWPSLRYIEIWRELPNSGEEDEEEVLAGMLRRNTKREGSTYVKKAGAETIEVDEKIRAEAAVATEDGSVTVKGTGPSGERRASSKDAPVRLPYAYDPNITDPASAFFQAVDSSVANRARKNRNN